MVALNESFAPGKPALGSKNRVGDFFGGVAVRAGENRPATRNRIGENGLTLTIIASGRPVWPSRDPIEEAGGLNLYAMVGNDPVDRWDRLGLDWTITRDSSKNWATAKPDSSSDTFEDLADQLRLNYSERMSWLKVLQEGADSSSFVSDSDSSNPACEYEIPNVVGVFTSEPVIGDGIVTIATSLRGVAVSSGQAYGQKNYKVVEFLDSSSSSDFRSLWTHDGIFAIAFGGHGSKFGFISEPGTLAWFGNDAVNPGDVSPPYKLQAVGAYSCNSADALESTSIDADGNVVTYGWRDHISDNGTFVGYVGYVNWWNLNSSQISQNAGHIPD